MTHNFACHDFLVNDIVTRTNIDMPQNASQEINPTANQRTAEVKAKKIYLTNIRSHFDILRVGEKYN